MATLLNSSTAPSIQDQILAQMENDLFGSPISQAAPEIASLANPTALSDSSQLGGIDYNFYSDPGSSTSSNASNNTRLGSGDPVQDFISALTPSDLSEYGSDVGYF